MMSRSASGALGAVLALASFAACSGGGSSNNNPGAGGEGTQPGGSAGSSQAAGTGGKSSSSGGATNQAGDGTTLAGAGGAGGQLSPQVAMFWQDFAAALCHRYFHCPDEADPEAHSRLRALAKTEQSCADFLLNRVLLTDSHVAALNAGTTAGALHLQQSWVAGCLQTAALCNYPYTEPGAGEIKIEDVATCREVFEGNVAAKGDCDLSEECAGDSMCVRGSAGTCAGQCAPRAAEAMACKANGECASAPTEWAACTDLQCEAFAVGTAASDGTACTLHSNQGLCHDDSWCAGGVGCAHALALGAACDPDTVGKNECLDGHCVSAKCTAFTVSSQVGDACDMDATLCDSFASLACVSGKCAKADGQNCSDGYWFDRALCAPKLLGKDGAKCTTSAQCQSGICRPQTGCVATLCSAK